MRILGIETSCDETAVCLIEADGSLPANTEKSNDFQFTIFGNALMSQAEMHAEYGGVYPNLAKREHARNLVPILVQALTEAGALVLTESPGVSKRQLDELREMLSREPGLFARLAIFLASYEKPDVDAIAITNGPGLEPALWVGVNFARALAHAWDIPIVAVNHMEGHMVISTAKESGISPFPLPALALLISGGHTELVLMPKWLSYEKVGETRDDAVGEAFDKVARLLGLPYPGGPAISKLAQEARDEKLSKPFSLPRPMVGSGNLDFSFSGIKTAVRLLAEKQNNLTDTIKKQTAREFEDAVAEVVCKKTAAAIEEYGVQTLIVGGGVSANRFIRHELANMIMAEFMGLEFRIAAPEYATDNALMIALAGYFHAMRGEYSEIETLRAAGNLSL